MEKKCIVDQRFCINNSEEKKLKKEHQQTGK